MEIIVDLSRVTRIDVDKGFALELPDGSTTKDLITEVAGKLPHIDLRHVLILVNDELIYSNRGLADGDVIKMFPPIMGG